jgi:hypothetical protein
MNENIQKEGKKRELTAWHLLLIIPFIAALWVPFYASKDPEVFGIPFFYWYQFLWVIISAGITGVVYFATKEK